MSTKLPTTQKHKSRPLQALLPSGLASVAVHGLIVAITFWTAKGCEPGIPAEAGGNEFRTIGLTTTPSHAANEQTNRDAPPTEDESPPRKGDVEPTPDVNAAVPESSPDITELLKHSDSSTQSQATKALNVIGAGAPLPGLDPPPQVVQQNGGNIVGGSPTPGPNETSFADIIDGGTRFVYLIDTSGSMSNNGRLGKAMIQLMSSLRMLKPHQEFQVIFYGDRPTTMILKGGKKRIYQANLRNIDNAEDELSNVPLGGGTDHLLALEAALKLDPEVVYFLTDGQDASHTNGDLESLLSQNKSNARIHVIEFAAGASETRGITWLHRLANQTRGQYRRLQM
jgi:hypothetical protein